MSKIKKYSSPSDCPRWDASRVGDVPTIDEIMSLHDRHAYMNPSSRKYLSQRLKWFFGQPYVSMKYSINHMFPQMGRGVDPMYLYKEVKQWEQENSTGLNSAASWAARAIVLWSAHKQEELGILKVHDVFKISEHSKEPVETRPRPPVSDVEQSESPGDSSDRSDEVQDYRKKWNELLPVLKRKLEECRVRGECLQKYLGWEPHNLIDWSKNLIASYDDNLPHLQRFDATRSFLNESWNGLDDRTFFDYLYYETLRAGILGPRLLPTVERIECLGRGGDGSYSQRYRCVFSNNVGDTYTARLEHYHIGMMIDAEVDLHPDVFAFWREDRSPPLLEAASSGAESTSDVVVTSVPENDASPSRSTDTENGPPPSGDATPGSELIRLGDTHATQFPTTDLCKGTLVVGDTGSGKTHFVKHFIESVVEQVPSLRNVLVIDWKGDLTDMIRCADRDDVAVRKFDELVDVDVVTFGQGEGAGIRCTLSPFPILQKLDEMEVPWPNLPVPVREKFRKLAREFAVQVLVGTIVPTKTGKLVLRSGVSLPHMETTTRAAREKAAEDIVMTIGLMLLKLKLAGAAMPRKWAELICELRQLHEPQVGNLECGTLRKVDNAIVFETVLHPISKNDVDSLAMYLGKLLNPLASIQQILEEASSDVVPMDESVLFRPPSEGRKTRIVVVNLPTLDDDSLKHTIAYAVLDRTKNYAARLSSSDRCPSTMLVIDEAWAVLPNCGAAMESEEVAATTLVLNMVREKRWVGLAVVLATQRPSHLHSHLRTLMTGCRLVGQFQSTASDVESVLKDVFTIANGVDRKALANARHMLKSLGPKMFMAQSSDNLTIRHVRAGTLKRLHAATAEWARPVAEVESHPIVVAYASRKRQRED